MGTAFTAFDCAYNYSLFFFFKPIYIFLLENHTDSRGATARIESIVSRSSDPISIIIGSVLALNEIKILESGGIGKTRILSGGRGGLGTIGWRADNYEAPSVYSIALSDGKWAISRAT